MALIVKKQKKPNPSLIRFCGNQGGSWASWNTMLSKGAVTWQHAPPGSKAQTSGWLRRCVCARVCVCMAGISGRHLQAPGILAKVEAQAHTQIHTGSHTHANIRTHSTTHSAPSPLQLVKVWVPACVNKVNYNHSQCKRSKSYFQDSRQC